MPKISSSISFTRQMNAEYNDPCMELKLTRECDLALLAFCLFAYPFLSFVQEKVLDVLYHSASTVELRDVAGVGKWRKTVEDCGTWKLKLTGSC
jgi:hypothetical protein